jgi:hypothetical protein
MSTVRFKRQSVKVATFEQGQQVLSESVDALVLGSLAIHKPLQGGGYCVTHIPSGFKMAEAWKRKNCKALVEKLNALDVDWNFTAKRPTPDYFEKVVPIVRAFNSNPDN